jgi:isochorismate synthase
MSCYALYRLPFAKSYTEIAQNDTEIEQFTSCTELNGCQGFVVAPFQVTTERPILLIRADRIAEHPTEPTDRLRARLIETVSHRSDYAADFADFHAQLQTGIFRKIVLARRATLRMSEACDPHQLFLLACQRYPRMFIALVMLPDGDCWLTATPEILLEGNGTEWRTIALAGTMQLQGNELAFDAPPSSKNTVDLRWSTKNIQEQRYVATYIANTLERFAPGFHEDGPRTVRAANLVHLRSDFTFSLADSSHLGDLLDALHPTPAVCGLPKQETFQFITTHEHAPRQYYSGFMGPLNLPCSPQEKNSSTHLYVSLRCMQMQQSQCFCHLYAGGGLLKDSIEEQEWQETEAKMQTMRNLLVTIP